MSEVSDKTFEGLKNSEKEVSSLDLQGTDATDEKMADKCLDVAKETDSPELKNENFPELSKSSADGTETTSPINTQDILTEDEIKAAIEKMKKAMRYNEEVLAKSLERSYNILKRLPDKSKILSASADKLSRKDSNDDNLSCSSEGESEASCEVSRLLARNLSISSGYISPSLSSHSTLFSSRNSFLITPSLRSGATSRVTSARSDSLETLVTEGSPSPCLTFKNDFCQSSTTRKIRKYYNSTFDFEDFKNACSLDPNTFKKFLNIKYITLPITRFLMEDLLDFVDFLNGTAVELKDSEANQCPVTCQDRQFAFVREGFGIGIQQLEFHTLNILLEEICNYIHEDVKSSVDSLNPEVAVLSQCLQNLELQQEKTSNLKTELKFLDIVPSDETCGFISLDKYRLLKVDADIEKIDDPFVAERLEFVNESIRRLIMRFISDSKMVLEVCLNTKHSILEQRLKEYLAELKFMLQRLNMLRKDSVLLLEKSSDQDENSRILKILKVKIQVGSSLQQMLMKLSEANLKFLEN